ncbi:MAG: geranylgeranylglyceryl/heptaprenylglyceryl phosphate synthase [Thermoplasmatales archaeon]
MILEDMKYGRLRHLTLLDPEKYNGENVRDVINVINEAGSSGILVGGSTGTTQRRVDSLVSEIKKRTNKPVILFPSSPSAFSPRADGIFYLSLLNSSSLKYVIGYQVMAGRLLKKSRMEVISVAYLVFEPGMTVGRVGRAKLIGRDDVSTALDFAAAAELIGFDAIYLEAGSGAPTSIEPEVVRQVSSESTIPVIVGGGIRAPDRARNMLDAGAATVVTGTIAEHNPKALKEIVEALRD